MKFRLYMNYLLLLFIGLTVGSKTFGQDEIKFNTQTWMFHNLNVDRFRNGDEIPEAKSIEEWESFNKAKKPAWCYYNFDSNNESNCGKLYNWYAVNDSRNIAPINWRIPTNMDWDKLILFVSTSTDANKAKGNKTWDLKNNKSNRNGFWLFQVAGFIENYKSEKRPSDIFKLKGTSSKWWSYEGEFVTIHKKYRLPFRSVNNTNEHNAYSIRCIKY